MPVFISEPSEAASPFICALQADPSVGKSVKGKGVKKAAATAAAAAAAADADLQAETEVCAHLGLPGHS